MAVQSKQLTVSNSSGPLKIKPFEFKNLNPTTTTSHPIVLIGKKPTGKSWIIKEILYNNNTAKNNISKLEEINELASLINTKLHL